MMPNRRTYPYPLLMAVVFAANSMVGGKAMAGKSKPEPSVVELVRQLGSDYPLQVRWRARYSLKRLGADAVPALIKALGSDDRVQRVYAAQTLGQIGDPTAIPALAKLADHHDDDASRWALGAIGDIGGRGAVDALISAFPGREPQAQISIITELSRMHGPRSEAALRRMKDDATDWGVYYAAKLGLHPHLKERDKLIWLAVEAIPEPPEGAEAAIAERRRHDPAIAQPLSVHDFRSQATIDRARDWLVKLAGLKASQGDDATAIVERLMDLYLWRQNARKIGGGKAERAKQLIVRIDHLAVFALKRGVKLGGPTLKQHCRESLENIK